MKNKIRLEEEVCGIKFVMFNDIILGTIYKEIDGFYVFKPNKENNGYWSEYILIEVANLLTELNKSWSDYIVTETEEKHRLAKLKK